MPPRISTSRLAGNRLQTRFGVDWGRVALTTVGAHGHYEYRAVGDAVNTANRIQELNKRLGTRILVAEAVLGGAGGEFLTAQPRPIPAPRQEPRHARSMS